MSDYMLAKAQVAERIRTRVLGYLDEGVTHDDAAHYAIADELTRIELRVRALASAAFTAAMTRQDHDSLCARMLLAIAEGSELP